MSQTCCISPTLATRIIATFGLSTTVLMMNVLGSRYFSRKDDEQFIEEGVRSWSFLGINWILLVNMGNKQALLVVICIGFYAMISLFVNISLSYGSATKKTSYFLPWIYFQMFGIIDQALALASRLVYFHNVEDSISSHIPLSSFYLLMSTYFWMIVCGARNEWRDNPPSYNDVCSVNVVPSNDCNLPKSPSFLAVISHPQFDSPKKLPPENPCSHSVPPKFFPV